MRNIRYAVLAMIMFASLASRGEQYEVTRSPGLPDPRVPGSSSEIITIEKVPESKPNQGCYIATAVYGSYDCPQVWTLRRYRDDTLASTRDGRCFIHTYYAISPALVRWVGQEDWFVNTSKRALDKMVRQLNEAGVSNLPYDDKQW